MPLDAIGIQMGQGYPGQISRNGGSPEVVARPVNPSDTYAIRFGDAVFATSNAQIIGGTHSSTESLQATIAGTTNTSTSITAVANAATTAWNGAPITVGMLVVGPGIPSGATVTAVAGTTVTINPAATASATVLLSFLSPLVSTANLVGVAVREVKTMAGSYNPVPQYGTYSQGQSCDVIQRGSVQVMVAVGSPLQNGSVYLRVGLNSAFPAGFIGGFEAAADAGASGYNTILIPNFRFFSGVLDSNNVAEVAILYRNTA